MVETEQSQTFGNPIGDRLKAAREAKGITLDEIAARTRIPLRHLRHIEMGEWDALPAATYSVGFARSYATVVGLNAAEIGAELREQLGQKTYTAAPAYYEQTDPARVPPRSLAIWVGLIAILLAAVYMIWRSGAVDDTAVDEEQIASVETQLPPVQPMNPGASQPGAPAASGPVVITATSDVWLRVYEADGARLFENTLRAGERYEVPATAQRPQILTGRPDAIQVTVGQTQIPPLGPPQLTIADVSLLPADLLARSSAAPQVAPPSAVQQQPPPPPAE
jgi:cytoskeleton protein RodZ